MKRSQQCIFKLFSSTSKNIGVKYVTWHVILTSTTHLHLTAHAGQSFLNFKLVKVTPQHTWVTLNTHEQCCAQSQDRHSPDLHAALASTVAALHVSACLPNKGKSKCSPPHSYIFRGVSSLKWCLSHSFTALSTVNETTGKCHWDRWPVESARMEQGAIGSEAESRGVKHLRKTKPQGKVHTH